jgi:DNA-binding NarL/FixJ family response regulator
MMMKILVIDDSARLRKQIIDLLSELNGIEMISQACCARDAINTLHEMKPDVLILDIQMTGGSGLDVLRKIKQEDALPFVIMLTNHSSPPFRKSCTEAGATYFLDKSTEIRKVKQIIQSLLEGRNATTSKDENLIIACGNKNHDPLTDIE